MQVIDIKGRSRLFKAPSTCVISARDGVLIDGKKICGSVVLEPGAEVKISGRGELVVYSSSLDSVEVKNSSARKNMDLLHVIASIHERVEGILSHDNLDSALVELTVLSIDLDNAKSEILTTSSPEKLV